MGGAFSTGGAGGGSSGKTKARAARPPPGAAISATDRAVLDLKNARDRLQRYKDRLELDDARLVARARQAKVAGDTKAALGLLRIRKMKAREVESAEAQLLNVLQMVQTIDSKQNEAQVLAAMKRGKDTLQRMHEETTVEDVLNLMDEVHEQNELEREMNAALSAGGAALSVEDEAAVEAELDALMAGPSAKEGGELPAVPDLPPLPQAPSTELPAQQAAAPAASEGRVAVAS